MCDLLCVSQDCVHKYYQLLHCLLVCVSLCVLYNLLFALHLIALSDPSSIIPDHLLAGHCNKEFNVSMPPASKFAFPFALKNCLAPGSFVQLTTEMICLMSNALLLWYLIINNRNCLSVFVEAYCLD